MLIQDFIQEILSVFKDNINLTKKGEMFLESVVLENQELFIRVFTIFNEERRKDIYNLIFNQNKTLLKFINGPKIVTSYIKKVLVKMLEKGLYDTTNIKITEKNIIIPDVKKGYKIVFLADLQINNLIQTPNEIQQIINNIKADILILGGDIIDSPSDIFKIKDYLSNLYIPIKYYVRGNHEYTLSDSELKVFTNILDGLGFEDINNRHVYFKGFNIIGIDDVLSNKDNIELAYLNATIYINYNLVVTHNHDINYKLDKQDYKADLILSGHTHGGQIVFPFNKVDKITRLWKKRGLYKGEYVFMGFNRKYRNYTVNGLGGSKTPLRLNAQQEILVLNITNK